MEIKSKFSKLLQFFGILAIVVILTLLFTIDWKSDKKLDYPQPFDDIKEWVCLQAIGEQGYNSSLKQYIKSGEFIKLNPELENYCIPDIIEDKLPTFDEYCDNYSDLQSLCSENSDKYNLDFTKSKWRYTDSYRELKSISGYTDKEMQAKYKELEKVVNNCMPKIYAHFRTHLHRIYDMSTMRVVGFIEHPMYGEYLYKVYAVNYEIGNQYYCLVLVTDFGEYYWYDYLGGFNSVKDMLEFRSKSGY